jgi:hypothetical protein
VGSTAQASIVHAPSDINAAMFGFFRRLETARAQFIDATNNDARRSIQLLPSGAAREIPADLRTQDS